jgi:nicotinate-nucleotide adenylyltransferase
MRLGVFGGTFDPVHVGHLILAEQCREQGRLDQLLFVPAARPPHKQQPLTPFAQRVEMLQLAVAGQPAFRVDELEKDRAGPSYTVETLAELSRRNPNAELWLVLGADMLQDLPTWYMPARIAEMAGFLVAGRLGAQIVSQEQIGQALGVLATLRMQTVDMPLIDIASRDVRRRAGDGRTIRYMVPRAVEAYIHDKGLYRPQEMS